ncbi:hypothetical protein [Halorussus sp. MSC15.2]|uniref:hypothetical protein n=1 Tax=Halorussus sp. MSC15.2 TaxID=2283638 RepID=UPI0013D75C6E|nr:hypothetical protein [Halorussus sp. MSC15.2]NEU57812.1 hypothetical protein [Halorussus sp. MSC15.2]
MNRRTFLSGVCGGSIATGGCLGTGGSTPFVTNSSIEVTDRGCGSRKNTATLDYEKAATRLHIEGVLSGTTKCGGLNWSHAYNQESNRVILEILPTDDAQCPSCTRYYEYKGTATFREAPSVAVAFHSDPDVLADVGAVILSESGAEATP